MARVVIADAGPLIAFSGIDGLPILQALFSEVCIPESVKDECLAKTGVDAQRIDASIKAGWLVVKARERQSPFLAGSLGAGESDAIGLALEDAENSLLIMDDRLARRYALRKGLQIVGTVRLLDVAEQRGLIESSERSIREMSHVGYRVSNDLLKKIRSE